MTKQSVGPQNGKHYQPSNITPGYQIDESKQSVGGQIGKPYKLSNITPGYQIDESKQSVGPQNGKHYETTDTTPGYQIGDESKQSVGPQNGKHYETTDTTPGYQIGETKQSVGRQNGNNYDPTNITPGYQMGERRKVIDRRTDKSYEPSNIAGGYQIDPSRKVVDSGNDRKYRATDIARGHQIDESKNIMERQIDEDQGPSDIAYVYQVDENGSKLLPGGIVQAEILADPNKDCQITVDQGGAVSYAEFSRTRTEEQKIPDMKQPTKYHVQPQSKPVSTEDPQPYVHTSSKKTVKISDQDDHYPSGGDRISEKSQEHKRSDGTTISSDADASSYSKPNSDHSPRAESLKSSYPAHSEDKHLVKGDFTQKLQSNGESYDKKPSGDRVVSPKSASAKTYKDEIIRGTEIKNHRKKLQEDDKKKHKNGPVRKSGQDTSSAVESMVTSASPTHSEKTVTSTDIKTDDKTQDSGESTSARTKDDEKSQESGKKPKKERVPIMCYRKGKEPPVLPAKKPPTVPVPDPSIESIPTVQAAEPPTSLQDRGVNTDNVETVTDSSESSDSSESIPRLCLCCNTAEAKYRSRLRGLPNQLQRALCDPCFIQNQQVTMPGSRPYYTYPGHVCCCYTMIKTETVRKIQRTVQELEDLDRERNLCSCTYGCKLHKHTGKRERCSKAVAYTLTFEDVEKTDSDDDLRRRHKRPPLEEVRVKIPHFVKKSKKDRENRKKSKHEKRKKHHKSDNDTKTLTLQDHLVTNRPNFIASAEERRQALIELAYMREERCQKYKQLLAMSNGVFSERNVSNKLSKPHMFSSKEMKKITANNYKKLPEVQKKLEENRNQQIKRANKILSDMFNRKLRERVLKGKLSLSTNTSVIKLT
ncbi:ALMS motif [Popillia japonica]|uniref:ALMS motif n=1 Tax=Popillia japonica TaxID=7064 RepID=A0AAW1L7J0_POPJA